MKNDSFDSEHKEEHQSSIDDYKYIEKMMNDDQK